VSEDLRRTRQSDCLLQRRVCKLAVPRAFLGWQTPGALRRALGLGATLTTLNLWFFEKETEEALGLPSDVHCYALLPIGYPMGRFGPVRRAPLADVVYKNRWGEPYRNL